MCAKSKIFVKIGADFALRVFERQDRFILQEFFVKIIADANIPFVKECFSSLGEVEAVAGRGLAAGHLADADCLLVRSVTKVNENLLRNSSVKFVATATIGTEHIDEQYLASRGIGFAAAPGSNANSVAEYIVAALLYAGEKHRIRLKGKSIGIVGVGNVGSKVEKKCVALGMKIVCNDPPLQRQTGDAKYRPIEEIYNCDIVTLHAPLTFEGTDKTFHLADEKFFKSLKAGCIFINTARGGVHDTAALKTSIKSGKLKATILDVWENEPNIDNNLLRLVDISTPHIAGYSFDGKVAGMTMIYNAACEFFDIKPKYTIDDFLPEPTVPKIKIESSSDDVQQVLHETVQRLYPIGRDDFNTREILMVPHDRRGRFFDDLRKNYPVRREFQNTTIVTKDKRLAGILTGIGFKV
jgi:erythronate-4-phosphate dehydrogenase